MAAALSQFGVIVVDPVHFAEEIAQWIILWVQGGAVVYTDDAPPLDAAGLPKLFCISYYLRTRVDHVRPVWPIPLSAHSNNL